MEDTKPDPTISFPPTACHNAMTLEQCSTSKGRNYYLTKLQPPQRLMHKWLIWTQLVIYLRAEHRPSDATQTSQLPKKIVPPPAEYTPKR